MSFDDDVSIEWLSHICVSFIVTFTGFNIFIFFTKITEYGINFLCFGMFW